MSRYASQTSVSVERTKAEIERLLAARGAQQFASGWKGTTAVLAFALGRRSIRFLLPMPDPTAKEFTRTEVRNVRRTHEDARRRWEQACRSRWRALFLVIKAKLEAVDCGISTVEDEFLAWTVIPGDGRTVGERFQPELRAAIESGEPPRLLLTGGAS